MDVQAKPAKSMPSHHSPRKGLRVLSDRILYLSNQGIPRVDFLHEISKILLDFFGGDAIGFSLNDGDTPSHFETVRGQKPSFRLDPRPPDKSQRGGDAAVPLLRMKNFLLHLARRGAICIADTRDQAAIRTASQMKFPLRAPSFSGDYRSLALIPLMAEDYSLGFLQMKSLKPGLFDETKTDSCRTVARSLGAALVNQRTQSALRERVKELTCLYGIARIAERLDAPLENILEKIAALLPSAWQYPNITCSRIILDGRTCSHARFADMGGKLSADIVIDGKLRGSIEVGYTDERPESDEGPFLKEERSLINAIARQVALIIEQKEAEQESTQLQDQLRHADRLATIGQLAAGLAHEINEPLGNILGFAQLIQKHPALPKQPGSDIQKIINASLHARDVIKNLLLFARQMPPKKSSVDLNRVVERGLGFIEHQCAKANIELVRLLSPGLPTITADPAQINQVLINLAVNAIQAMPNGGRLTVRTLIRKDKVVLAIEDTGVGMNDEIKKQIFNPFFTTKDVHQGTGLGLSVAHGIVLAHKGTIQVESQVGRGTSFEIQLPVAESQESDHENKKSLSR